MSNPRMNNIVESKRAAVAPVRCAIYTRKSTEEGLDQDFNTLDAQREAAEAYITSQKGAGWICLPERYDDGGFTGGNLDRPALRRLLKEVEAGRVECVIVYKVDRLSRSLMDFARIMETLDGHKVSFVSVTQQFNTTSSMGRLTLNILLSFAQFEREIIAERTRDKMSAARRKGKWIGGSLLLGYDLDRAVKRLVVNDAEAEQVRQAYAIYLKHEALQPAAKEINGLGIRTKSWVSDRGRQQGGKQFNKSSLYSLLTNHTYTGKILFQGVIYPGEQPAIVAAELFGRVQDTLRRNHRAGGASVRNKHGALLKGLLVCEPCECAMVHCFTPRGGRVYRYYVCSKAQKQGWESCPSKSLPAHEVENFVVERIRAIGTDESLVKAVVAQLEKKADDWKTRLRSERADCEREMRKISSEIEAAVRVAEPQAGETSLADRLAGLQERMRGAELRLEDVNMRLNDAASARVPPDLALKALRDFDKVWGALSPAEQARSLRLLIEQVRFDGRQGTLTLQFRAGGVTALADPSFIRQENQNAHPEH